MLCILPSSFSFTYLFSTHIYLLPLLHHQVPSLLDYFSCHINTLWYFSSYSKPSCTSHLQLQFTLLFCCISQTSQCLSTLASSVSSSILSSVYTAASLRPHRSISQWPTHPQFTTCLSVLTSRSILTALDIVSHFSILKTFSLLRFSDTPTLLSIIVSLFIHPQALLLHPCRVSWLFY